MNVWKRTVTAAVVTLVGAFTLDALPAAASTQSNYIKALHRAAPSTKAFSNKKLVGLAKADCASLSFAPISDVAGLLDEPSNTFHFPKAQVPKVVTVAVDYYCPKYKKDLASLKKVPTQTAAPKTTQTTAPKTASPPPPPTPTVPALTQQQQSAVEAAKQYLSTQAFSQQGLIDQLDSSAGSGYSVNDATVAVDSLNVNWNNEAVLAAKEYLQTQPFSCTDLIQQLDSSAGDQYTVAQATYGATQAGGCAGGVPATGSTGSTGSTGNTP
jgi:hypothetical protein